jgi:hypothetical protein
MLSNSNCYIVDVHAHFGYYNGVHGPALPGAPLTCVGLLVLTPPAPAVLACTTVDCAVRGNCSAINIHCP